jgi:hypothetical protein
MDNLKKNQDVDLAEKELENGGHSNQTAFVTRWNRQLQILFKCYRESGFGAMMRVLLLGKCTEFYGRPEWNSAVFQYAKFNGGNLVVDGFIPASNPMREGSLKFSVVGTDGRVFVAQNMSFSDYYFAHIIGGGYRFRFAVDATMPPGSYYCWATNGGAEYRLHILVGSNFPIHPTHKHAYLIVGNGLKFQLLPDGGFSVKKASRKSNIASECAFCFDLLRTLSFAGFLAIFLRTAARALRIIHGKRIWIFSDKMGNPFDSAYATAQALLNRPEFAGEQISVYYVVAKKEPRMKEIAAHLSVLKYMSLQHALYFLLAEVNVTSEGGYNPFTPRTASYLDMLARQLRVWCGHGIIHHDMAAIYGKDHQNFGLMALGVEREREYLLGGLWGYDPEELAQTGLARWDFRETHPKKWVYFIFTWRANLVAGIDLRAQQRIYENSFAESQFCLRLQGLMSSAKLREVALLSGYELCFVPHPLVVPAMEHFKFPEYIRVVLPGSKLGKTYYEIYAETSLLVTDYSSVAMDMAYMGVPVVYYQFDRDEFYASQGYAQSYFSWENDGFGDVLQDLDAVVDCIASHIKNGCVRSEKYNRRAVAFFPPRDKDNGYRTCRAILEALKRRNG